MGQRQVMALAQTKREKLGMLYDTLEMIDLGNGYRLQVGYDDMSRDDCPLEWTGADFYVTSEAWGSICGATWASKASDAIGQAVGYLADEEALESAIVRHCLRAGRNAKRLTLTGSSQGEWLEGVYAWDVGTGDASETLQKWFEGSVYNVTLERAVTYARVDVSNSVAVADMTDTLTHWDCMYSLSGCYLTSEYTAMDVVRDHFHIDLGATAQAAQSGH